MIATLTKKLFDKLRRKSYREAYVDENVRTGIAYQIRALREQRGWSQKKLAEVLGKPQSVLSRIEDPDYGKLSVQTLLEVAAALDVALLIQYVAFPEFIERTREVSPEALQADSFHETQFAIEDGVPAHAVMTHADLKPSSIAGITGLKSVLNTVYVAQSTPQNVLWSQVATFIPEQQFGLNDLTAFAGVAPFTGYATAIPATDMLEVAALKRELAAKEARIAELQAQLEERQTNIVLAVFDQRQTYARGVVGRSSVPSRPSPRSSLISTGQGGEGIA